MNALGLGLDNSMAIGGTWRSLEQFEGQGEKKENREMMEEKGKKRKQVKEEVSTKCNFFAYGSVCIV